jgi:hypothetical protein
VIKSIGYEYIDEFINNDKDEFKKVVRHLLYTERHLLYTDEFINNVDSIYSEEKNDSCELLYELAK